MIMLNSRDANIITAMGNTFSCLNVHCVFRTKERVPILNPEVRERLWPYLGGIAKQNGIILSALAESLTMLSASLNADRKSTSMIKKWIIGPDSSSHSGNGGTSLGKQGYGAFRVSV
jgi:Transposase IS200 like